MSYFYATPYAVVLGNNLKTYTRVTPNRCARMCLEEDTFVCKSFDYQVRVTFCNVGYHWPASSLNSTALCSGHLES